MANRNSVRQMDDTLSTPPKHVVIWTCILGHTNTIHSAAASPERSVRTWAWGKSLACSITQKKYSLRNMTAYLFDSATNWDQRSHPLEICRRKIDFSRPQLCGCTYCIRVESSQSACLFCVHLIRVIQKARSAVNINRTSFFNIFFRLFLSLK